MCGCNCVETVLRIQPCKDPVTKVLFGKFGYKVVYFWVACNAMLILSSVYYGTLTEIHLPFESSEGTVTVPLLEDEIFYIYFILGICGIILINQVLKAVSRTFDNLWENNILQSKSKRKRLVKEYNRQLREVEKKINSKKSYIFAAIFILISFALIFIDFYKIPITEASVIVHNDFRIFPLSGIVAYTTYAILYFVLMVMIYKSILLTYFLRKLHKTFYFQVNPFHPDRCGGLKFIGDFIITIDYIIFIFLIVIVASFVFPHSEELNLFLYFNLPLYILLALFFFFYPLLPIHNSMKEQKYNMMSKLKEKLGSEYRETLDELMEKDMEVRLRAPPKKIFETVDVMSIWPFDVGGLPIEHLGKLPEILKKPAKKLIEYGLSVAYPKFLSKRYGSHFEVVIYPPDKQKNVKEMLKKEVERYNIEHIDETGLIPGLTIVIKFSSPNIEFSDEVTKILGNRKEQTQFIGNPKENCYPGKNSVKLSITDKETNHEYVSRVFEVEVVDYAIDHVSRPLLSKITSIVSALAATITYALTLLGQIDTVFGLASGTAAGIFALFVYRQFRSLFQQPNIIINLGADL